MSPIIYWNDERIRNRQLAEKLRLYDEVLHPSLLCLPKEIRHNLAKPARILEDSKRMAHVECMVQPV